VIFGSSLRVEFPTEVDQTTKQVWFADGEDWFNVFYPDVVKGGTSVNLDVSLNSGKIHVF